MPAFIHKPLVFLALMLLPGLSLAQPVTVTDGFARAPIPGAPNTSAYMTIHNHTDSPLVLVGGSTPMAKRLELHAHIREEGMMKMRKLDEMVVKVGQPLYLLPGGLHLMLFELDPAMAEQKQIEITLNFSNHDPVTISLPLKSVMKEQGSHHDHH